MEEALDKTLRAGEILKEVSKYLEEKVVVGARLLDVAEFVENKIIELGASQPFRATYR